VTRGKHRGWSSDQVLGALLTGIGVAACLGAVALVAAATSYDGPRGLRPYTIEGRTYAPRDLDAYDSVGVASWYGEPFHGRPTANGERYDQHDLSAAHRTLPLGTRVQVTRLATGRSLFLRVTDRGPFVDGRIIDVSREAARRLGFLEEGLARVRVRRLRSPL